MARVAIFHEAGRPFELVELPVPNPVGLEVLVSVSCCTLCRSDLHTHAGRRQEPSPIVLGHEIVGRIVAFGPDALRTDFSGQPLTENQRVTWSVAASCGDCFPCRENLPQKCATLFKYGHQRFTREKPFSGGLAEYVLLAPGTTIVRLADKLSDTHAALVNCATATASAVLRTAGTLANKRLLILGAGVLGLMAVSQARAMGVSQIIVCEPDEARRQQAVSFGATDIVDPAECPRGIVDVVLELAGTKQAVEAALAGPRVGGTVVLAGTVQSTPGVNFDPESVVRRMLTIKGNHNYTPTDLAKAVDFLERQSGSLPIEELVGPTFALADVDAAFTHGHAHPGQHVAVVPNLATV